MNAPMSADVFWNAEEKIIGVVGVAPAATADFYAKLIALTPVKKDWEHVQVVIDSNPKIPSRGRYLELGETDPVPFIRHSMQKLQQMGASIIALPCNTAHILYDRYAENSAVIVPNMIAVTAAAVKQKTQKKSQRIAVFASRLTQAHQLYETFFTPLGMRTLDTSAHQAAVSRLIEAVKQGHSLAELKADMNAILSAYEADVFVMGCTELSLLTEASFKGIPIIDSNRALAAACLALAGNAAYAAKSELS